ncbi:MAG: efflux RND transporter periplasmic adaptor subunit [Hyphomonadaceae bacterium]
MADTAPQQLRAAPDRIASETQPQPTPEAPAPVSRRRMLLGALAGVVTLSMLAYGGYWLAAASHYVSTDNAYVGGDSALVAPLTAGPVSEVMVGETQAVKAGDVLVKLDDADAKLDLAEARATLAGARADFERARIDWGRRRVLSATGAVSQDELTSARNAFVTGQARVEAAAARVESAELALTRTVLRAPIAGLVTRKSVQVGQRVAVGAPLMTIVPADDFYVDANFKEPQLRKVAIGQKVELVSDLYGGQVKYSGVVSGLSAGTGSAFALIPAQNASGNWIKVVQRVPVRIELDQKELRAHPLRVGLSMKAKIDVNSKG